MLLTHNSTVLQVPLTNIYLKFSILLNRTWPKFLISLKILIFFEKKKMSPSVKYYFQLTRLRLFPGNNFWVLAKSSKLNKLINQFQLLSLINILEVVWNWNVNWNVNFKKGSVLARNLKNLSGELRRDNWKLSRIIYLYVSKWSNDEYVVSYVVRLWWMEGEL